MSWTNRKNMKIQIDTKLKTIKVEDKVNLSELVIFLKDILKDDFSKYTIETNTIINWNNPIYVEPYWRKSQPYSPYWGMTHTTNTASIQANKFPDTTTSSNNLIVCFDLIADSGIHITKTCLNSKIEVNNDSF